MQYDMHVFGTYKLYVGTIPEHGVVRAPLFGCRKVRLSETATDYSITEWLPGYFSPDECLEWLGVSSSPDSVVE